MPATENNYEGKPFLSIIAGSFRKKVDPGTPGAKLREYELSDGSKGEKWELSYPGWRGIVRELRVVDTEYGDVLHVEFDDVILSLSMDKSFATDFLRKFAGADVHTEIVVTPYDFVTDEGKRKTGVSIVQCDEKLKDFFTEYNESKERTYREGFPVPDEKMSKDDWKIYYLSVKKYLKNWVILDPINTIGDQVDRGDKVEEVDKVSIQESAAIPGAPWTPVIPEHKGKLDDIEF